MDTKKKKKEKKQFLRPLRIAVKKRKKKNLVFKGISKKKEFPNKKKEFPIKKKNFLIKKKNLHAVF